MLKRRLQPFDAARTSLRYLSSSVGSRAAASWLLPIQAPIPTRSVVSSTSWAGGSAKAARPRRLSTKPCSNEAHISASRCYGCTASATHFTRCHIVAIILRLSRGREDRARSWNLMFRAAMAMLSMATHNYGLPRSATTSTHSRAVIEIASRGIDQPLAEIYGKRAPNTEQFGRTPSPVSLRFRRYTQNEKGRHCGARHSVRRATLRRYFGD